MHTTACKVKVLGSQKQIRLSVWRQHADQRCLFLQMKGVRFADEIKQHNQPCPCEIIKRTAVIPSPQIWGVSQLLILIKKQKQEFMKPEEPHSLYIIIAHS